MCPGWLEGAGFLRAAWPPETPASLPAELRTTAARSERQVGRQRDRRELDLGEGWTVRKRKKRGRREARKGEKRRRKGRHE